MTIKKLPEYLINRLKAWEIVDRPSSIVKELVENSLDAGADTITINIHDGGKRLISVEDNWSGIQLSDMDLVLERYATSKIESEADLYTIGSYGFRGEALASISEVSKTTITTKTPYAEIATKLVKRGQELVVTHLPVWFTQGTVVLIEDVFYNVPARLKFLKSTQTEYYYCYNYFVDVALWNYNKHFILKKNDKIVFDLHPTKGLIERITDIFKKDWTSNFKTLSYQDEQITLQGVVSDAHVRFWSQENIKIYVNGRPIQDKIIMRALLDAYHRQLTPGEYPFAVLMLDVKPDVVDVNVHPAKLQVKFVDSQKIYQIVHDTVGYALAGQKISTIWNVESLMTSKSFVSSGEAFQQISQTQLFSDVQEGSSTPSLSSFTTFDSLSSDEVYTDPDIWEYQIVGQLWNSYITLQTIDALYYIDQHALAERIMFEKLKKERDMTSELLLSPHKFEIVDVPQVQEKIDQLNQLWFDCSLLTERVLVVYAVPKIFVMYPVHLETLFNHVLYVDRISFDHVLDGAIATKACKASIKAGQKLSYQQMASLIKEWFEHIPSLFVCQHGRPFFVKMEKNKIDGLFDR